MIVRKLISSEIPTLTLKNSVHEALSIMQEFHLYHLAVVKNNKLIGVVSEDNLLSLNDEQIEIESLKNKIQMLFMPLGKDVFEIIKYMDQHALSLLPIISEEKYIGVITHQSVISSLASIVAIQESGGVIILEMNKKDYSMSEIAQIVESNGARILNSFITEVNENEVIKLTLKLNVLNIAPIIQTFERYEYTVAMIYNYSENNDDLSDRYDSLMRYLNP